MGHDAKQTYLERIYGQYPEANRAEKSVILDEFCKVCGLYLANMPYDCSSTPLGVDGVRHNLSSYVDANLCTKMKPYSHRSPAFGKPRIMFALKS